MYNQMVCDALVYAIKAHGKITSDRPTGQVRKYSGDPYVVHLCRVWNNLMNMAPDSPGFVQQVAILHDIAEDTENSISDIAVAFGTDVAAMVATLTDPPKEFGNRKARKAMVRDKLSKADFWTQMVKLSDILDNAQDIGDNDPSFYVVYQNEINSLLDVFDKVDPALVIKVRNIVNRMGQK